MAKKVAPKTSEEKENEDALEQGAETLEQGEEGESSSSTEEIEVDYEAIALQESERAEEQRKARERAENALADRAFKERKERREEGGEEQPLTETRLREILNEDRQVNRSEQERERIERIAQEIAVSEAEAKAIIATHANRRFPSNLSLREQLEETQAIVNRKKTVAREAEIRRTVNSKETTVTDAAQAHRDSSGNVVAPKLAQSTVQILSQTGFKWNPERRLYSKKLENGKILFANPKAGPGERRQWVE